MFKSTLSSYLPWFKRTSSTSHNASTAAGGSANGSTTTTGGGSDSFVVPSLDHNQLINISMKDEDDSQSFVEIQYRKLTYAEAAAIKPGRSQNQDKLHKASATAKSLAKPRKERPAENQYTVLNSDEGLDYEPYKSDVSYRKSKQFKEKQFETVQKKKQRNALFKKEKA